MTIGKLLTSMTPVELEQWVSERRGARSLAIELKKSKKPKKASVASLARSLGLTKAEVVKQLEKTLFPSPEKD